MKKQLLFGVLALSTGMSFAQNVSIGADGMHIEGSTAFAVKDWNLESSGDIVGDGDLVMISTSTGQNLNMNGNSVNNLLVDNTNDITLTGNAIIGNDLEFSAGDVDIASNDLTIADGGTITNASASNKVLTTGSGNLVQTVNTSALIFPVAFASGDYNPVTLTAAAAGNDVSVRATDDVLDGGNTGTAFTTDVVDVRWNINNAGSDALDITLQWAVGQETTDFDRTNAGIGRYEGSGDWDLTAAMLGAAGGSDPYTLSRTGVTTTGVFAIGDAESDLIGAIVLNARVLLQGPYDAAGIMKDDLNTADVIPTTEPYTALSGFTHTLNGGGETSTIVNTDNSDNTNVVDWVFVELRDATTPATVVASRSALVRKDGLVVDTDGTSPVTFEGVTAGNYYFSINHRNHLGVMSGAAVAVNKTPTAYDLSNPASTDYVADYILPASPAGTVAQYTSSDSYKYMISGDVNADGSVLSGSLPSDVNEIDDFILDDANNPFLGAPSSISPTLSYNGIVNTYSEFDVNLDGSVFSGSLPSDANFVDDLILDYINNPFSGAPSTISPTLSYFGVVQQIP
jgi:hypothetical protein